MSPTPRRAVFRFRTVFISDLHLGFRGCSAEYLLDFLTSMETETLYLVGDIVDLLSLRRSFFWPASHQAVIAALLEKARTGTRVIYVPGNHDIMLRDLDGQRFGNIEVQRQSVHTLADGRRFLVMHGDEFDNVIKISPWLETVGDHAYTFILMLNRYVNAWRRRRGMNYWSLAAYLKDQAKEAVSYIANFERAVAAEARRRGVDGIVCGHIHRAGISEIDGVTYCNDGDWVESCTTLTEDEDGSLMVLRWTEHKEVLSRNTPRGELLPVERAA
jgi:UDP-2,3-diacylglucosamine pyrophosphatase LpxH